MDLNNLISKANPTNSDLMQAIAKFMESNNSKHEELKKCSNDIKNNLESAVAEIKQEIGITKERVCRLEMEMNKTSTVVESLIMELNSTKQKIIENDILISGIPSNFTDKTDILKKLSETYTFDFGNVRSSFMKTITVKRSGRSGSGAFNQITVAFKDKTTKESVMSKVRSNGPLYVKQLFPSFGKTSAVISIRERLTTLNLEIMKKLLDLKKKKKITYCWFRHNNIYVKISPIDTEKPTIVRSLSETVKFDQ